MLSSVTLCHNVLNADDDGEGNNRHDVRIGRVMTDVSAPDTTRLKDTSDSILAHQIEKIKKNLHRNRQ